MSSKTYGSFRTDSTPRRPTHCLPSAQDSITSRRARVPQHRDLGEQKHGGNRERRATHSHCKTWHAITTIIVVVVGLAALASPSFRTSRTPATSIKSFVGTPSTTNVGRNHTFPGPAAEAGRVASTLVELTAPTTTTVAPTISSFGFEARNFYHVRDGKPGLQYPWLEGTKLAEPHRETTLTVVDPEDIGVGNEEGAQYNWEVRDPGSRKLLATATGLEVVVVFTQLDENIVVLRETRAGMVTREVEETVMVKYVRREVRTLTDGERDELFDAVSDCERGKQAGSDSILKPNK